MTAHPFADPLPIDAVLGSIADALAVRTALDLVAPAGVLRRN
ncbi:MAG TPA: hypothetical protein PLQ11_11340 [Beijerinckiaceae bacterium]|nr:hypothetical protein [Beijerinckiaceae bacterium]